jgi:Zn-dependent protease
MSLNAPSYGQARRVGTLWDIPISVAPSYGLFVLAVLLYAGLNYTGALWLGVTTIGVLVHELGHALPSKRFGLRPRIVLHALGGWCEHEPARNRAQDFQVSFGGPAAGLALALVSWLAAELVQSFAPGWLSLALYYAATVNVSLTLFNLLPVLPLDGGRMLHVGLGWFTSNQRADGVTLWSTVVLGSAFAVAGLARGSLLVALLMGSMAYQAWPQLRHHPFQRTFDRERRDRPASYGGLRLDLPTNAWRIAGALVAVWALDSLFSLGLVGIFGLAGESWQAFTFPWVHSWFDWPVLVLALVTLWLTSPRVGRRLGDTGLLALYVGAGALGAVTAWVAVPGLASNGAAASSMALWTLWTLLAPNEPVRLGRLSLPAWQVTIGMVSLDVLATTGGLTRWDLPVHLGGVFAGLLAYGVVRLRDRRQLVDPPQVDLS